MSTQVRGKNVKQLGIAIWMLLFLLVVLSASTWAWFTFSRYTNIVPMTSYVGDGPVDLVISNQYDGTYAESCDLNLDYNPDTLKPCSTSDLKSFYIASGTPNADKVYTKFKKLDTFAEYVQYGKVYIKASGPCDLYFNSEYLGFGSDNQALAGTRLGIIIGEKTYIFKLDEFMTGAAEEQATVIGDNKIVDSASGVLTGDVAETFAAYLSDGKTRGVSPLYSVTNEDGEIVQIEYFYYIEGCDPHSSNKIQAKDTAMQLGFTGFDSGE